MRASVEIDAYPTNARQWEAQHGVEASEEINANFGYGSQFHETHGYYVDGIDEATAKLPLDWRDRQHSTAIECDGRIVWAITPDISDLVVSKLCRLDPRDAEVHRNTSRATTTGPLHRAPQVDRHGYQSRRERSRNRLHRRPESVAFRFSLVYPAVNDKTVSDPKFRPANHMEKEEIITF